jgi:hypothetical protein
MTTTDARACDPIIPDPTSPHPTHPRRPPSGRRPPAPARLPGRRRGLADALQTHPEAAEFLVTDKQAHDLLVVKANQPTLLARCAGLPWHRVPVLDRTRDRGHGRIELRTLKAVSVNHFGFRTPRRSSRSPARPGGLYTRRWRTVTVYAITSLTAQQASPARLADLLRGHWASRRCTTSATPPSLRMPPRSAPAAAPTSWPACATWSSGPQPGGAGQPRRRLAPPRPRPRPSPDHLGITLGCSDETDTPRGRRSPGPPGEMIEVSGWWLIPGSATSTRTR